MDRQTDILEIILALRSSCGFAGRLDCGQEKRDENADDRNHDQQLDQGERRSTGWS